MAKTKKIKVPLVLPKPIGVKTPAGVGIGNMPKGMPPVEMPMPGMPKMPKKMPMK